MADELGVTLFGVSAKYIDACAKAGLKPMETHNLSTLKTICSTGSTLIPESLSTFTRTSKRCAPSIDVWWYRFVWMSGGWRSHRSPVNKGEIQKAALGMEIEILNEHGGRVRKGEQGELVCASVFPSCQSVS